MTRLLLSRLMSLIPVLVIASIFIFLLSYLMPIDPVRILLGEGATDSAISAMRDELGLSGSPFVRYGEWVLGAAQGDLGTSLFTRQAVTSMVGSRLSVTISLSIAGIVAALVVGLSLGLYAALHLGSWADRLLAGLNSVWIAVPSFWLGLILVLIFGVQFEWFPVIGYTPLTEDPLRWAWGLVLPGIALGLNPAAVIARQTRAAMRDANQASFILAMRARGIQHRKIVRRYVIRNALIPVIAVIGIQVPLIVGGTLVVEQVFSQPGLGALVTEAVLRSDLFVLQGGVLVIVIFVLLLNLLVDVSYGIVDPRVQSE